MSRSPGWPSGDRALAGAATALKERERDDRDDEIARLKSKVGRSPWNGELLKLGFEVAQSSVAKYMAKRRGPPSQGWRTFLHNHAPDIAAMDLFVVPTIGFKLLYAFVVVRLERRDLVWINVTAHPTAEWVAHQITEAFPWNEAPRYMIRTAIGSTAPSSHDDCAPWAFGTSLLHRPHPGRTALPNV